MDILKYSTLELSEKIKNKEFSVVEVIKMTLDLIEKENNIYNDFNYIASKEALQKADEIQTKINEGMLDTLVTGVPVAIKDNICTKGILTTCSSKILKDFVPSYSATVVEKIEKAGAIIIGKTNMDEFAMGSTSETSYNGTVKNPYDIMKVSGGSSSGSAVSVALNHSYFSLGSDTGGSVRQPASYCNVVGLKPTYGRVSRNGLIAYASSFEQIGPICKNVKDCAYIYKLISGYDKKDSTTVNKEVEDINLNNSDECILNLRKIKIGIPKDYLDLKIEKGTKECILNAIRILEANGAIIEEFEFGYRDYVVPAYYTIAMAQASSNLERYDGVKYGFRTSHYEDLYEMYKKTRSEGFGEEVKRRIMMGTFILSAGYYEDYYLKALKVRELIKRRMDEVYSKYDIVLTPVSGCTAPYIGESLNNRIEMYSGDIYTVLANLTNVPAISVPCGMDDKNMPVGLQLMANVFEEKKLLEVAYAFESLYSFDKSVLERNNVIELLRKED